MTVEHRAPKRPYRKPTLKVIGSMQEITAAIDPASANPDSGAYPTDTTNS